jgi:amino acid transporter
MQPAIFTILSSISIVLIYLSYLLVTVPLLRKRLLKQWPLRDEQSEAGFTTGKWGLPVNILAVLWGGAMTLNLIWPRPEIYNSVPPFEWYLQWGGVIFVAAVIIGGTLLYRLKIRHQTGVLAEHAAAVAAHPSSGAAQYGAAQSEAPEDALAVKMAASEA